MKDEASLLEQVAGVILEQLRPEFPLGELEPADGWYFSSYETRRYMVWLNFKPARITVWADDENGHSTADKWFHYTDPELLQQLRAHLRQRYG